MKERNQTTLMLLLSQPHLVMAAGKYAGVKVNRLLIDFQTTVAWSHKKADRFSSVAPQESSEFFVPRSKERTKERTKRLCEDVNGAN
jgi:hypothetical protein